MTKRQLIEQIAKDCDIPKNKAGIAIKSLTEGIQKALEEKGKITLTGFGTFKKIGLKAREGRDPSSGKKIAIKARNVVRFRPGKTLKDAISGSPA